MKHKHRARTKRQRGLEGILGTSDKAKLFMHDVEIFVIQYEISCINLDNRKSNRDIDEVRLQAFQHAERLASELKSIIRSLKDCLPEKKINYLAPPHEPPSAALSDSELDPMLNSLIANLTWHISFTTARTDLAKVGHRRSSDERDDLIASMARCFEENRLGRISIQPRSKFYRVVAATLESIDKPLADYKHAIKNGTSL